MAAEINTEGNQGAFFSDVLHIFIENQNSVLDQKLHNHLTRTPGSVLTKDTDNLVEVDRSDVPKCL